MATDSVPTLQKLRILTLNTHKGFSPLNRKYVLSDLRQAVRGVGADLVFMQEVLGYHNILERQHADQDKTPSQYEYLADSIWDNYAYGRNSVYDQGHHGNALMSKLPIVNYRNIDVSAHRIEQRGILHCEIPMPHSGRTLHAVSLHLGLLESWRRRQLQALADLVQLIPAHEPLVIAGDFNDWRGRANRIMANSGLTEVFQQAYGVSPRTFPARFPFLRLDRIYVRGIHSIEPLSLGRRPWTLLSDHVPLAADLEVI